MNQILTARAYRIEIIHSNLKTCVALEAKKLNINDLVVDMFN